MSFSLLFAISVIDWFSPTAWRLIVAAALLTLSLWQAMPNGRMPGRLRRWTVIVSGLAGLLLIWSGVPALGTVSAQAAFAGFGMLTLIAAVATISSRSPVYSAIWFALSLLGTAALFFLQQAQFLGIATVAVYAGAIVVTFLFVLMLAQPEGQAYYDRISWGTTPRFVGCLAATFFAVLIAGFVGSPSRVALRERTETLAQLQELLDAGLPNSHVRAVRYLAGGEGAEVHVSIAVPLMRQEEWLAARPQLQEQILRQQVALHPSWKLASVRLIEEDVQTVDHTAHVGAELFGRHWIAVQGAGALLMAALVGAVAIVGRGGALDR